MADKNLLSSRPLGSTALDREFYLRRPALDNRLARAISQGFNTLVVGDRGMGKTSLLRHHHGLLQEQEKPVVYIDAALAQSALRLLELIRHELGLSPVLSEAARERFQVALALGLGGANPDTMLLRTVRALKGAPEGTVIMVDGVPSAEDGHLLFGRLRDELWELGYVWVVACDTTQQQSLLAPPADVFFEAIVRIEPLGPNEQRSLLERRVIDPDDLRALIDASRAPRDLLALAREAVLDGRSVDEVLKRRRDQVARAEQVSSAAARTLSVLAALDRPVSASDPELLAALGVSRPRAQSMLSELVEHGLVTKEQSAGNGRGRPRVLYRPLHQAVQLPPQGSAGT